MSNRRAFHQFRSNFADGTLMAQAKAAAVAMPDTQTTTPADIRPMRLADFNDTDGTFVGYLAVFNNVDLGNDTILPGAFTQTIADAKQHAKDSGHADVLWPVLWQHDANQPIGGIVNAKEDTYGLKIWAFLDLNIPQGRQAYAALKAGYVSGLSIGYDVVKQRYQSGVRQILQANLWEGSVVTFPMNPEAQVQTVKGRSMTSIQHGRVADAVQEAVAVIEEVARKDREKRASRLAASDATAEVKRKLAGDYGISDWAEQRLWQEEYERAYQMRLKLLEVEDGLHQIKAVRSTPPSRSSLPPEVVAELRRAARKVRSEDVQRAMHPRAYR